MGQQPSPAGRSLTSEVSTSGTASADEMLNIASERFFFFFKDFLSQAGFFSRSSKSLPCLDKTYSLILNIIKNVESRGSRRKA